MPTVTFENVSKIFADYAAIRNINFKIADGEFVVFVGPSGCGKTTTLRMLAGLETPSYGSIFFDEVDVTLVPPGRRDIAMVFQSYALYPHLSTYQNLAFGPRARHEDKQLTDQRIREVARMLGLDSLLGRRPSELSGGQRQRIALGRAMVRQPKVFLLDEPLSNLDAALRAQMRIEITDLQRRLGVTTAYVTHDQVEALTMGHRIAVFNKGELLQIDTPQRLYQQPVNEFVATFIGSPKMNLVPGTLERFDQSVFLKCLGRNTQLSDRQAKGLRSGDISSVNIGLRPQDVHWTQDAPGRCTQKIRGIVHAVEPTGAETFVIVDVDGQSVEAQFPSFSQIRPGDQVELVFDSEDLYVFDAASGVNLLSGYVRDGEALLLSA
ncbi:ABC transporter ATP-binding protein [Acidisoma cellulosilytica]|uniref:ABC transporter ATP-binding protein n=2 Tax=Acidisoma cellulosilyticum TaxID=2802395 RepID=A0A964E6M6_9PROT|nr:ABC transporter ATP-binding protein [Acidisoma cellulosilyticum]